MSWSNNSKYTRLMSWTFTDHQQRLWHADMSSTNQAAQVTCTREGLKAPLISWLPMATHGRLRPCALGQGLPTHKCSIKEVTDKQTQGSYVHTPPPMWAGGGVCVTEEVRQPGSGWSSGSKGKSPTWWGCPRYGVAPIHRTDKETGGRGGWANLLIGAPPHPGHARRSHTCISFASISGSTTLTHKNRLNIYSHTETSDVTRLWNDVGETLTYSFPLRGLTHFLKQELLSQNSSFRKLSPRSTHLQSSSLQHEQKLKSLPKLFTRASKWIISPREQSVAPKCKDPVAQLLSTTPWRSSGLSGITV